MVKVFWRSKTNRIGGLFAKMANKEWKEAGSYPDESTAEYAVRQWRKYTQFRNNFEFSIGALPSN